MKHVQLFLIVLFTSLYCFSQPKIGSYYKGGIVYEVYSDGSGGKLYFFTVSGTFNELMKEIDGGVYNSDGIKYYMADDYDLQKLFQQNLIGPDSYEGSTWGHLWWLGTRRMQSYGKPLAYKASGIRDLPTESNARIAKIVQYADAIDRYDGKCRAAIIGIYSLKKK